MIYYKSFNKLLQTEFKKRSDNNPSYSLRTFARDLEISPSLISYYLSDQKIPSKKTIISLGEKLGIAEDELQVYLIPAGDVDNSDDLFTSLYQSGDQIEQQDVIAIASDFYHYAVLQAMNLKDFQPNSKWLSEKLSLTIDEVEDIIGRLQRLNLLLIDDDGKWTSQTSSRVTNITSDASVEANKSLQQQVLDGASNALHEMTYDEMDQTSIMFPTLEKNLPKIKDRIVKFRRELAAEFTQEQEFDVIYQFSFAAYPITKKDPS